MSHTPDSYDGTCAKQKGCGWELNPQLCCGEAPALSRYKELCCFLLYQKRMLGYTFKVLLARVTRVNSKVLSASSLPLTGCRVAFGAFLCVVSHVGDLDLTLSLSLPRLCISSPGTALPRLSVSALRSDGCAGRARRRSRRSGQRLGGSDTRGWDILSQPSEMLVGSHSLGLGKINQTAPHSSPQ